MKTKTYPKFWVKKDKRETQALWRIDSENGQMHIATNGSPNWSNSQMTEELAGCGHLKRISKTAAKKKFPTVTI